jgi:hypothetical protein
MGARRWFSMAATLALVATALGTTTGRAAGPVTVAACTWPVTFGPDEINLLAPDSAADYWMAPFVAVPGTKLVIHGEYPAARYFSLTVNDMGGITLGSLRDDRLDPDPGSENPFRGPTTHAGPHTYTATISFAEPPPGGAEPNTFHAGRTLEGRPNLGGTIWIRNYVSDDPASRSGGVALPTITLVGPGDTHLVLLSHCGSLPPDDVLAPTNAIDHIPRPDALPELPNRSADYADPPFFQVIYSGHPIDPVLAPLPDQVEALVPRPEGTFLANADFPYMRSAITRAFGEVAVIRIKTPTFPDTRSGEPVYADREARYWSLCSYSAFEESLNRLLGCLTDYNATTADDGFTYIVIADEAHKPAVSFGHDGVHWLDWGIWDKVMPFYRQGIPADDFAGNVLHVPRGTDPASVLGDYAPLIRYCTAQTIEHAGPAACF